MAEPILKWAGGKRQLMPKILPRLPSDYNKYFEPFFGGGAVFFALNPDNGYINDINPKLMNYYQQVREKPELIIAENRELDEKYSGLDEDEREDFYYERREEFNSLRKGGSCSDPVQEAILFLFLNRTCWNGLYRTNEQGDFNVPVGSKWTNVSAIESRIREASDVLQGTNLSSQDFEYIKGIVEENDLVFLDPPYPVESKTAKFDKYHEGGFDEENQVRIRDLIVDLHFQGVKILLTNGPSAKEWFNEDTLPSDFRFQPVFGQRMINSNSSRRTGIGPTELLITNIPTFGIQKTFDDYRSTASK